MILGIDPGQTGALALVDSEGEYLALWDMPVTERSSGKGKEVNAFLLADIVDEAATAASGQGEALDVVIERVGAMPGQGVTSMFNFGRSLGVVEGVIASMGLPYRWALPNRWKRAQGLTGRDKDAARTVAIQRFPEARQELTRKKDIGRADALLIAHYGAME